jgi:hypothetical protein
MFGLGIKIYSGEDLPLKESDFLTEEEKVLSEKNKEKEKLDRIIKVAKEKWQIFPAINFNPKSKHC